MGHLWSKGSRRAADGVLGTQLKDTAELQDTLRSPDTKCGWLVSEMGLLRAGSRCGKGRGERDNRATASPGQGHPQRKKDRHRRAGCPPKYPKK